MQYVTRLAFCGLPSRVVGELLVQRLGDAGGDPAVHLALGDQRVDDPPGVVDRDHPLERRPRRSRCRPRPRPRAPRTGTSAARPGSRPRRSARPGGSRESRREARSPQESAGCGRAGDVEATLLDVQHHVLGIGLELGGGERLALLDDLLGGLCRRPRRRSGSTWSRTCRSRAGPRRCRRLVTVIFSIGSPSRSAAICANVVSWPWPCENEPVRTIASPVGGDLNRRRTRCSEIPLVTSTYTLRPIPSCLAASPFSPAAGLLAAELVVAGALEREVERAAVVADVVVGARRPSCTGRRRSG